MIDDKSASILIKYLNLVRFRLVLRLDHYSLKATTLKYLVNTSYCKLKGKLI